MLFLPQAAMACVTPVALLEDREDGNGFREAAKSLRCGKIKGAAFPVRGVLAARSPHLLRWLLP
jgi:hypothetical protein